jgi:hypothetical protein
MGLLYLYLYFPCRPVVACYRVTLLVVDFKYKDITVPNKYLSWSFHPGHNSINACRLDGRVRWIIKCNVSETNCISITTIIIIITMVGLHNSSEATVCPRGTFRQILFVTYISYSLSLRRGLKILSHLSKFESSNRKLLNWQWEEKCSLMETGSFHLELCLDRVL